MSTDRRISEPAYETTTSSSPATEHKSADQIITTQGASGGSGEAAVQNPSGEDF